VTHVISRRGGRRYRAPAPAPSSWGCSHGSRSDFGVGARLNYPTLGQIVGVRGLEAHGSFDWHFPGSDLTLWEANLNATYAVAIAGLPKLAPYVGGGLSYVHTSLDVLGVSVSGSDTGFNALAGARFTVASKYRMFAEARFAFHDSTHFVLTAGLLL